MQRDLAADETYGAIVKRLNTSIVLSRRAVAWLILLQFYRRLLSATVIIALWNYTFAQVVLSILIQLFYTVNVAHFKMFRDAGE